METLLLLYTEPPTRLVFKNNRPGRLIFASDVITSEDRSVYDECVQLPPVTDVAATLSVLDSIAADKVVVQTEYGLLPGSLLAQKRGLPAPTPEAASLCTNKWLFRNACKSQGVKIPEFALAQNVDDVKKFAQTFPIVLKPIASTLQRFVAKVESAEALEDEVSRILSGIPTAPDVVRYREFARLARVDMDCDPYRQFLVEEFIDAPPLETDGLVIDENIDLFGVVEQVHTDAPHFFIEGYLFPGDTDQHLELKQTSEAAIKAIGLTNAGFSIEFRGGYVIEVNGRLGEDEGFPDLFQAAIGQFPILKWINRDTTPATPSGYHAVAYQCWYKQGLIVSVPDPDGATVLVSPGQRMYAPPHPDIWPHLAYALASHPASSREAYNIARSKVDSLKFDILCE